MMITKNFKYKGQMVNYYNKVKANPSVETCYCGYFASEGCWQVSYKYKK